MELANGSMITTETNINTESVIVRNMVFLFSLGQCFSDNYLESG